ncbi:Ubiquitin carboxyl-terminal hydrolase 47 [Homalodisca vitripennis]|nr:Ubiquitin carboxyl-terminal hydrolase 47 [Homalodisca vitripennis]
MLSTLLQTLKLGGIVAPADYLLVSYNPHQESIETLKLDSIVAPADCRLVSYNPNQESIEVSFDGRETESMSEILVDLKTDDMLLEIKNPDDEFEVYQPGDISVKAYYVDLEKEEVKVPPFLIRSPLSNTVGNLKDIITMNIRANTPSNNMVFVIEKYCYELSILEDDSSTLQQSGFSTSNKGGHPKIKNKLGSLTL